jgi:ATP-dependent DNA helicase 2 subunit 1
MWQRTGDYVLSWADELEKQYAKTSAAGSKSTLVKRGVKDRTSEAEDAAQKPNKKVKVDTNEQGVEDVVNAHYQKGSLSKVTITLPYYISFVFECFN